MSNTSPARVKTGIPGFDNLIGGGFSQGKIILLSGTPGTCKTIFALQYLYNGAAKFKEKGLYFSFEEHAESLKNQAKQFGWDLDKLEKKGMIKIIYIPPRAIRETLPDDIVKLAKKGSYRRIVIDSLSALAINTPTTRLKITELTDHAIKRFVYHFINDLRAATGATVLLTSQTTNTQLSRDTVSEFVCDGVIHITYESLGGEYSRSLMVRKMRETNHDDDMHALAIGTKGLVVHKLE